MQIRPSTYPLTLEPRTPVRKGVCMCVLRSDLLPNYDQTETRRETCRTSY